jgi:Tol biopolymer transport system component
VFIMNADGSNPRQITSQKTVCTYSAISPDGKKIVFRQIASTPGWLWTLESWDRNSEVFVMDIDGKNMVNVSNHPAYDGWPVWLPDGQILFSSNRAGNPKNADLYRVRADGSGLTRIPHPAGTFVQATVWKNSIYAAHNIGGEYDSHAIAVVPLK